MSLRKEIKVGVIIIRSGVLVPMNFIIFWLLNLRVKWMLIVFWEKAMSLNSSYMVLLMSPVSILPKIFPSSNSNLGPTLKKYIYLALLGLRCCVDFSLVVASGDYSLVVVHRLLIAWLLLWQNTSSRE